MLGLAQICARGWGQTIASAVVPCIMMSHVGMDASVPLVATHCLMSVYDGWASLVTLVTGAQGRTALTLAVFTRKNPVNSSLFGALGEVWDARLFGALATCQWQWSTHWLSRPRAGPAVHGSCCLGMPGPP